MISDPPSGSKTLSAAPSWVLRSLSNGGAAPGIALALGCTALLLFGVLNVGRSGTGGGDLYVLWVAGSTWLHGLNPYDPAQLAAAALGGKEPGAFAYPPHIAPLCLALGIFPFTVARWLMIAANLTSAFLVAEFSGRLLTSDDRQLNSAWLPSIVFGIPFAAHTVHMGQTSLFAVASLMAAVWYAGRKQPVAAGLLLFVASTKPQLALLVVVWFLFRREFKLLAVTSIAGVLALAVPAIVAGGPVQMIEAWLQGMRHYQSVEFNQLGFRHMFGIRNFLFTLKLNLPGVEVLALGGFLAVWRKRDAMSDLEVAAVLLVIAMLCLPVHDYDLVALLPFVFAFAQLTINNPRMRWCGLALLAALFFPQRFLRPFDSRILEQFRVPVVLAGLGLWTYLKATAQQPGTAVTVPDGAKP